VYCAGHQEGQEYASVPRRQRAPPQAQHPVRDEVAPGRDVLAQTLVPEGPIFVFSFIVSTEPPSHPPSRHLANPGTYPQNPLMV
jgi:hypothetical protein